LSYSANKSRNSRSRGTRVFGLFVAVWLNLALQPCAMALQAPAESHCPHCPPAKVHEHGMAHAAMERSTPCDDGGECSVDDSVSHDVRAGQVKLKHPAVELPAAISAGDSGLAAHTLTGQRLAPEPDYHFAGAPPPLHVLYCVYLD
jgi:hypothetical protein